MSVTRLSALLVLVLAADRLATDLRAAAPPPQPLPSRIAEWVNQLGHDDLEKRRVASAKLRAAGEHAEAALEKAAESSEAEIKRRSRAILNDFHRGIYPDTPPAVIALINKYETVTSQEKAAVIRKLMASGTPGCRALVKLARRETDPVTRKEVFVDLFAGLSSAVPSLIESGNTAALEGLLELALQGDVKLGVPHFAAYHLLNGTLPKQVARLEREAKGKVVAKAEHEVLAYLYRANGDLDRAIKAAREAERDDLLEGFLYEKADWKTLNARPDLIDVGDRTRHLGLRAAYARLSGDEKTYLASVKGIIDLAKPVAESKGNLMPHAKALFLNGRADDALALLAKTGAMQRLRYDLLATRLKFAEASALVEQARKNKSTELPSLELAHARTLHVLGEKAKAITALEKYTGMIKEGLEPADWHTELVEAELAIGRRDKAYAAAAMTLAHVNDGGTSAKLFDKLFGDRAEEAAALWLVLRRPPAKRDHDAAMKRLRALMEGKATREEVEQLVAAAEKVPEKTPAPQQADAWRASGEAAVRCKQEALAAECFRKAGDVRGLVRLGDLRANKKEWGEAAGAYLRAYRLSIKEAGDDRPRASEGHRGLPALALYLHGHALKQAGKASEGDRRTEQAHLLPLGDAEARYELMKDLLRRGHVKASAREQAYLRRLGEPALLEPNSYYTGEGLRAAAIAASEAKQWVKAADGFEQSFLRVLHPDLNFGRNVAYVSVPAFIYRMRAQGLAEAKKYDEARAEARRSRDALPDSIDLTQRLVPLFEAGDRRKDADELYKATKEVYANLLKEYPKAAYLHNQLAWLSATCKRDLVAGLASAKKAVELEPDRAAYHDTLAEVLFQSGKKDDAIKAQRRALALDPKREYFKKQLKRIEAGDPKAARPTDDE